MAYTEYHIDGRYKLYGRYYHTLSQSENNNPFLAAHRTVLDATGDTTLAARYQRWQQLDGLPDVLAADAQGDKYIPLTCNLVVPNGAGAPFPLAIFIHGQSDTYFDRDGNPAPETKSYRGYRYLQHYLGDRGVATVSVNVNVASFLKGLAGGGHDDYEPQARIQICFLVLAALKQISSTPVTTGQPIFLKRASGLVPLQDGLALTGSFSSNTPESLLLALKAGLNGKLSFTTLGFMGHSRGGDTVQALQPYFTARTGTAPGNYTIQGASPTSILPLPTGPYNSNTRQGSLPGLRTIAHQYHYIHDVAAVFGSPTTANLKTVVALQPPDHRAWIDSMTTFYFVLASSHDEDVQEDSFNGYENANCPKAMIFSHGAVHSRFNTVWRQLSGTRTKVNRSLVCQSPIHMLSNAGHENLAKATIANALLAGLRSEHHRYRLFTDQIRAASIGQDMERAWKFPFPFGSPPAFVLLDGRALTAVNTSVAPPTAVTVEVEANLSARIVAGHRVYANKVAAKRLTRPANQSLILRIPVQPGDGLVTRSHFNFRYTKEYDAQDSTARRRVNLRNYTLRLKAGSTVIGNPIPGSEVRTQVHAAYPTRQWSHELPGGGGCYDDTMIILQTAEVPLSQFLGTQPLTDLNQVDTIEVTLNGSASAGSGNEVWFFVDFLLVSRDLPAAPAGFSIP